jgi:hypothetical protein
MNAGRPSPQATAGIGRVDDFAPWLWQPSDSAWFDRVHDQAAQWEPSRELRLDGEQIRRVIQENAAKRARWLVHPCVNAITSPKLESKLQRDFQLAVWIALSTSEALGVVTLDGPIWAWAPGGGIRLEPGAHDLAALARTLGKQEDSSPITVDPWARSMKMSFHQLWRDATPFGVEEETALKAELKLLLRALTAAEHYLADCFAWVRSRTQVVIPLRQLSGEHSSSSSAADLPGVVFLTIHSELQAIEALVHESAHQHLFVAEAAALLVDPRHTARYKSPLRDDARPLRGVLLACHALAYMAAYYTDAKSASMSPIPSLETKIFATREKLIAARDILLANRQHLTAEGCVFLDRTLEVERYSA